MRDSFDVDRLADIDGLTEPGTKALGLCLLKQIILYLI